MARRKLRPDPQRSVEARELRTIRPDHSCWKPKGKLSLPQGSLVRVLPPHHVTDAAVERLVASLGDCADVRVAPREPAPVVVGSKAGKAVAEAVTSETRDHRAVVMTLAEESFAEDKDSLMNLLERWISEAEG